MNQNFDFSNSKHSLDNKSKVIDNQGANIENQNFHIHLAMNKKAFTIFVFIITTFLIFYCYKSYQEYKDKKYKEVYRALQYFKSFCFCKNKKIEELTSDDFIELEDLLINLPPKNKAEE